MKKLEKEEKELDMGISSKTTEEKRRVPTICME